MFIVLLFLGCGYICGASNESVADIVLGDKAYFKVQHEESRKNGFGYAAEDGATAQSILSDIQEARADMLCKKAYYGDEVDRWGGKTIKTVHFSLSHEYRLSLHAAAAFVREYGLRDGYFCVGLEDLGDYCFLRDKAFCLYQLQIGLPPNKHPLQRFCQSAYGFDAALKRYKDEHMCAPIVFFSSGRRGFRGAGEFLFQVYKHGLTAGDRTIHFFFTALPEQKYFEALMEIADAANTVALRERWVSSRESWLEVVKHNVGHIGCQQVHEGRVVFAQDHNNILASCHFDLSGYVKDQDVAECSKDKKGSWDVFVGWPGDDAKGLTPPYLAQSYRAFRALSDTLGAGCITGQEDADDMPNRSHHTLICVEGPSFGFAKKLGEDLQKKFGYKNVEFLACHVNNDACMSTSSLIVGGSLAELSKEEASYFDILSLHDRSLHDRSLQNYESGVVVHSRVYSRMHDRESYRNGFAYSCERWGTAQDILAKTKSARKDFSCNNVYCGWELDPRNLKIGKIMHMPMLYEKKLSEHAVDLLFKIFKLPEVFLCVSFEDLAHFCDVGGVSQDGVVHVSAPKDAPAGRRFADCFKKYIPGSPIVFCASGRGGFSSAGEFFNELVQNEDVRSQNPRLYFLFAAIEEKALGGCDAGKMIVHAARGLDVRDQYLSQNISYTTLFKDLTEVVAIARIYQGRLIFAQDSVNLMAGLRPNYNFHDVSSGKHDVLVNFLPKCDRDAVSVAYRLNAYRLFEEMRMYGHGCVTGEEDPDYANCQRTLLCINSPLFAGVRDFGEDVACRLGYKAVLFIACDDTVDNQNESLIAKGVVQKSLMPEALQSWAYRR